MASDAIQRGKTLPGETIRRSESEEKVTSAPAQPLTLAGFYSVHTSAQSEHTLDDRTVSEPLRSSSTVQTVLC